MKKLWKLQTDIPIPISYIFHAPLCIKKFQLMTQLMNSNFLLLIPFLACVPFLGLFCYLIKRQREYHELSLKIERHRDVFSWVGFPFLVVYCNWNPSTVSLIGI